MDGSRFDGFARGIARRFSRRQAIGGLGVAGLAGAAGRPVAARAAKDDDDLCVLEFWAAVQVGHSAGGRGREWAGTLRFTLDDDGDVSNGSLLLRGDDEDDALTVTGHAAGSAVTLRIVLDDEGSEALVAVGAGERKVARCRGMLSGVLTGPIPGDIGHWQASPPEDDEDDDDGEGCNPNDRLDCDVECEEGERLTYDCFCVTVGNAVCDVYCEEPQRLTDDCGCACLQS